LNRNVISVVLLLVPGLLFTAALPTRASRRAGIAALIVVTAIATLLSESGTSVMAFFLGALVLAVAALSLKAVRLLTVAAWVIAVLFAVPLGALPYGRIGRGCRRRALPPASISGSTWPTTSIKGRSQASASAARATCISRSQPTPTLRAPPMP